MENKINIGLLDTLVSLFEPTTGIGTQGETTKTWTKVADVYAYLEPNTDESIAYYNQESITSMVITIYKKRDLTTRWRVHIGSQKYEIISIDPISRVSNLCRLNIKSID